MIIFPAIDLKDGKCVRLAQGAFDRMTVYEDNPLSAARRWQSAGAEWLHIVDLDGARDGKSSSRNLEVVQEIAEVTGLPIQLGGGVRSVEIAERILSLGVRRVVAGTALARDAGAARELFEALGDRVVVGVDARDGIVAVQGWMEDTGESARAFVERLAQSGALRFVFTDIGRDGMLSGVNLEALNMAAGAAAPAMVIASGGVTTVADIHAISALQRSTAPNIEGAIVGKALYAGTLSLEDTIAAAVSTGE